MGLIDDIRNFLQSIANFILAAHRDRIEKQVLGIPEPKHKEKAVADITNIIAPAVGFELPAAPITPKNMWTKAQQQSTTINTSHIAVTTAMVAAEAASLGQLDYTLTEFMGLPWMQAMRDIATQTLVTPFRTAAMPLMQRYFLSVYQPMLPESYRLATMAAKGIITPTKYSASMSESGLSTDWANNWLRDQELYPPLATLAELRWRNVIDDDDFYEWLRLQQYPDWVAEALMNLLEMIPPAGDLVTMVVREAFDPKYVTPAPAVFAEYMAKKGFSKDWSDRYWTMHWVPIPLAQAYDNLRRGNWTPEQFLEALRIADIHPQWRQDILNVAYNPPSIREMGYGYDVGAYTIEEIIKYRMWGGLSKVDAEKAGVAMVAYRTEAERNAVRTEYMYLFGRGKMTIEEFEEELWDLGTAVEAVPLWLERARAYKERITKSVTPEEPASITRSVAQWLFEYGERKEDWLRTQLADLGYVPDAIDAFVDQSKKRIEQRLKPEKVVTARSLTSTQIRDLFRLKKITTEQLPAEFEKLGYSTKDAKRLADLMVQIEALPPTPRDYTRTDLADLYEAGWFDSIEIMESLRRIDYPESIAVSLTYLTILRVELPILKARYSKGWITSQQLYESILGLGIPDDKANIMMQTIVKAEQPARVTTERDLTKAEIVKGVKNKVITVEQAVELLMDLGYEEWEAYYILIINKVVEAGDPQGYWEMRKVTEAYKKSQGLPSIDIPDEVIMLEVETRKKKEEVEALKAQKAEEAVIAEKVVELADFEARLRTVITKAKLR